MKSSRPLFLTALAVLLVACGTPSNAPKPLPLPVVANKVAVSEAWRHSLGSVTGARLQPATNGSAIAAMSGDRRLVLLDASSGAQRWEVSLPGPAAGGVGLSDDLVVVGTLKGELLAYGLDAKLRWTRQTSSEIVAPPVVAGNQILVRGSDGRLTAYASADGAMKWAYTRQQPALQLRNFAPPVVSGSMVYLGQSGGRLAALSLPEGRVQWEVQVAQPRGVSELERIADVVARPVVGGGMVCAVAYQGRLACFSTRDGSPQWSREVSSWSGLTMDNKAVYVTDDAGNVIAYERSSGRNLWRQEKLGARSVSGPTVYGNQLLVGDYEGYLHFMNSEDGSFVAQYSTDGGAIVVAPQLVNGRWLIQTQKGGLIALGSK